MHEFSTINTVCMCVLIALFSFILVFSIVSILKSILTEYWNLLTWTNIFSLKYERILIHSVNNVNLGAQFKTTFEFRATKFKSLPIRIENARWEQNRMILEDYELLIYIWQKKREPVSTSRPLLEKKLRYCNVMISNANSINDGIRNKREKRAHK